MPGIGIWEHEDSGLIYKKGLLRFIFLSYYQSIQLFKTRGMYEKNYKYTASFIHPSFFT